MKRDAQGGGAVAEPLSGDAHLVSQPEYLLLSEVVSLLRFDVTAPADPREAAWSWLKRQAVPVKRRGRVLLIERRVLEAILSGSHGAGILSPNRNRR